MISVQNLQPLLSGNKLLNILSILLFSLIFMSCFSSKSTTYRPPQKPKVETVDKSEEKEDSVDIIPTATIEFDNENEDIVEEDLDFRKSSYNVKMILPFLSNEMEATSKVLEENNYQNQFMNFYLGSLLALDDLSQRGIQINLTVHDSRFDVGTVQGILNQSKYDLPDLIIGPISGKCMKIAAEFARQNKTLVVSPNWASSNTTDRNPYYIQLQEPLSKQFEYMVRSATSSFEVSDLYVVQAGEDVRKRVNYLKRVHSSIEGFDGRQMKVVNVNEADFITGENIFDEIFSTTGRKAILLPYYKSDEEVTIYNILRRLNAEKGFDDVTVYCLDVITGSSRVDYTVLNNLDLRLISSSFVDPDDRKTKKFQQRFYNKYSAIPTNEAAKGYDIMTYFGEALFEHGVAFPEKYMDTNEYVQTSFDIQPELREDIPLDSRESNVEYYQNKHLMIINFEDGAFRASPQGF